MNLQNLCHDLSARVEEADAPAGHAVRFREREDADDAIADVGQRSGRHALGIVVEKVLVDLVRDDDEVVRGRERGDPLDLRAGIHGARRVVRIAEENHGRSPRHGSLERIRVEPEVLLLAERHEPRHAARDADHLRVGGVRRRRQQDFLPGFEDREQRRGDRFDRAARDDDLAVRVVEHAVASDCVRDRFAKLRETGRQRVAAQLSAGELFADIGADRLRRIEARDSLGERHDAGEARRAQLHLLDRREPDVRGTTKASAPRGNAGDRLHVDFRARASSVTEPRSFATAASKLFRNPMTSAVWRPVETTSAGFPRRTAAMTSSAAIADGGRAGR